MSKVDNLKKAIRTLGNKDTLQALLKNPTNKGIEAIYKKYNKLFTTYDFPQNERITRVFDGSKIQKETRNQIVRVDLIGQLVRGGPIGSQDFKDNLANLATNSGINVGADLEKILERFEKPEEAKEEDPSTQQEAKEDTKVKASGGGVGPSPTIAESKKLSGRRTKGKVIEKGKQAVRKIDFSTGEEEKDDTSQKKTTEMEIGTDATQTPVPAPKVSLRGKRKPKPKEKLNIQPSATTIEEAERVLGKERVKAIIDDENKKLAELSDGEKFDKALEDLEEEGKKFDAEVEKIGVPNTSTSVPEPASEPAPPPPPEPVPEPAPAPAPTPPSTPIKMRVNKVTEIKKDVLPTAVDLIPPERLSSEDKTVQQLKDDIDYFYINFPQKLKRIKRPRSSNLKVLQRAHKRIVAVLRGDKVDRDAEKQVGVIIKGSDFIKDKLKEIILENSINGLSAEDLLVNIEGEKDTEKPTAGNYEFKTNPVTGKEYAEGQPVSRLIPTTEPAQVNTKQATYKKPIARIPMTRTMYRGKEVTAKKMVASNPFLDSRQPKIRLKYSY